LPPLLGTRHCSAITMFWCNHCCYYSMMAAVSIFEVLRLQCL